MIRFLLLSIFLWSCAEDKQSLAPENSVSMIISSDSVIIYRGKLKKNTAYQKIPIDEVRVKALLAKEKSRTSKEQSVLLKLSSGLMGDGGGGLMEPVLNLKNWSIESGMTNIVFADMDAMDEAIFKLVPLTWAMIDSFNRPLKLELTMPKDVPDEKKVIDEKNALTVILLSEEGGWCYTGREYGSGQLYSMEELRQLLIEKKKVLGDDLVVIIKPAESANYKATVNILDLMTTEHIKSYAMVKLSKEEESYFNSPHALKPPEPIKVQTPGSVTIQEMPADNAFLIEIKEDNSVWYHPRSLTSKMAPQEVKKPVKTNLQKIVADYEAGHTGVKITYLIKGHPKATYPLFEQVVSALKANNINKYNLVTSDD